MILIATEGDWAGRSLESVLVAHGYAVLRSGDGEDALALAKRYQPDAMILDEHLPGLSGIEVMKLLREEPGFDASTPIVITAPSPTQRQVRQEAYENGAWDFCTHPLEAETLILKLSTFLRARRALSEAREQALMDQTTGVLTHQSLERWAEQLAARASRNHEPLACVVLMPSDAKGGPRANETDQVTGAVSSFLQLSKDAFRRSDIVGRTADGRLALLAPDTDGDGVEGMLARLRAAIAEASAGATGFPSPTEFKAGYWAVHDFASAPLEPSELIRRAAKALDHISNPSPTERLAMSFDKIPIS
ncbi:MAG TPA: response regulator [Gemmatimonadaceae bacterium]|nr:response regulator [Gemmatimonadaceae bacterium]